VSIEPEKNRSIKVGHNFRQPNGAVAFYDSNFRFITKSLSRFRSQCGVKLDCDKPIEIVA
jgi:hypothetical protein